MSWKMPDWFARVPRVVRVLIAVPLVLMLMGSLLQGAEEMAAEGIWWAIGGIGAALLLLTASVRNWPLLWNALGRLLRALLGERGARVTFGVLAVTFMLPCVAHATAGLLAAFGRV
jgi:Na+/proline symporter